MQIDANVTALQRNDSKEIIPFTTHDFYYL